MMNKKPPYKKEVNPALHGMAAAKSAEWTAAQQFPQYNKNTAHGYTAEDANALNDMFHFKNVDKTGLNNTKNGADRMVDMTQIQTKYYQSARETINAAFDNQNGMYRYDNILLEVPRDQYDEAVRVFREKIAAGRVPGVSDPAKAANIVKQGDVTYQQAKNIAKAGNIDSLVFDMKTQAVASLYGVGISFTITYALAVWSGEDKTGALKIALNVAVRVGTITMIAGVATQQLLRTGIGRGIASANTHIARDMITSAYATETGKTLVHNFAKHVTNKNLTGAAAKNVCTKALRTNMITSAVTLTVITAPDFYRVMVNKSISWQQFSKNLVINGSGVAGGAGGAVVGGAVGNLPGAIVGGLIGGVGGAWSAKKVTGFIREDGEKMFDIVKANIKQMAEDYLVTEAEFETALRPKIEKIVDPKWLRQLYKTGRKSKTPQILRNEFVRSEFRKCFENILKSRKIVISPVPAIKPPSLLQKINYFMKSAVGRLKNILRFSFQN
jgi:hypothetical protein